MRLSWPSPLPIVCRTGRLAVGTLCPAAAALVDVPGVLVLFVLFVLFVLLALLPPQAVASEAAVSMRAIFSVREEVRAVLVIIGNPPLGSGPVWIRPESCRPARSARRCGQDLPR